MLNEREIESKIERQLINLGWIDDITHPNRNIFRQCAKTKDQNKRLF